MRSADALKELLLFDSPAFTSREAAIRLGLSASRTSQVLRSLQDAGLATQMRHGLWTTRGELDPYRLPPFLTAPLPSYVSYWSALSYHGIIEQVPRMVFVASLARARVIATPIGTYSIHKIATALFDGYGSPREGVFIATPEKALFDTVYLRASQGGRVSTPELELPRTFRRAKALSWVKSISSKGLRTRVRGSLEELFQSAMAR
jgi:predicted transcriptional regulator of viral defense system